MDRIPQPIEEWPLPVSAPLAKRVNWLRVAGFAGLLATVAMVAAIVATILATFRIQVTYEGTPEAVPGQASAATAVSSAPSSTLQLVADSASVGTDSAPLGIFVRGPSDLASTAAVELTGVPDGWALSEGRQLGNRWRIPTARLSAAAILPPRHSSGAVDLEVELRLADDTLVERRAVHWARAMTKSELAQENPAAENTGAGNPAALNRGTGNVAAGNLAGGNVAAENLAAEKLAAERVAAENTTYLLSTAEKLLASKDVAGARVPLQRAAEGGHAGAALILAQTYEGCSLPCPNREANRSAALYWYGKAAELGLAEARQRLDRLSSQPSSLTEAAASRQK